jgi:hypothetical protein
MVRYGANVSVRPRTVRWNLTATFMDYLLPAAMEIPTIEIEHQEVPTADGIASRGVGEGGAIAAPPMRSRMRSRNSACE